MTASASADLELLRASALLETDPAGAARRASGILVAAPAHAEAKLLLAAACRRLGDPAQALELLEAIVAAHPEVPVMQLELGRAYAAAGRSTAALAAFRRVVAIDAEFAEGWRELAAQLFAAGDETGGDVAYAHYKGRVTDPPGLQDTLAALADGRLNAAAAHLHERLLGNSRDVVALRLLAEVATRRNDLFEAERCLNECLQLAPGYARARYDLACLYFTQQRAERVLPLVERLLTLDPLHTACRLLKARTLRLVDRSDEAIALLEGVIAEDPRHAEAWLLLGHVRREGGEQALAIAAYRRVAELRPESGDAYWSLANLKTVRFTAAEVEAMRRLLARTSLLPADRVRLEFALGKALEDEGHYDESFAHYAHGNALHRATFSYDPEATTAVVRRSQELYTARFFAERHGWGSERADPIFIVGVPRSGSTLLEQMLASHSQVEGTRELTDLSVVIAELVARTAPSSRPPYPHWIAGLGRPEIEAAAAHYLARTQAHRSLGRPHFIDKMPNNFSHVGLIHLMFPKAAIIDARRHPLGCAFSCYKQLFAWSAAFSYDLAELGRHIRDYTELLEHVDAVLPGRVRRVYYERLVADPEAELRALLAYCRLPFETGCLRFYENRRIVQSVSSEQVRRPIYAEGVDQWRHFEAGLAPLKVALADIVDRYPVAGTVPG